MNFDKNTVIGFVLLMALLFGYIFFTNKDQAAYLADRKRQEDSVNSVKRTDSLRKEAEKKANNIVVADSAKSTDTIVVLPGSFIASKEPAKLTTLENDLMKVTFTSKGGYPVSVQLKKYNNFNGKPVELGGEGHRFYYDVMNGANSKVSTSDLQFIESGVTTTSDGKQQLRYKLAGEKASIEHIFTIKKDDYLIDWDVQIQGVDALLTGGKLSLNWDIVCHQQEKDLRYEKGQSNIGYFEDGSYDFYSAASSDKREFGNKTKWIGVKQQFFNTTAIVKNVDNIKSNWKVPASDSLRQVLSAENLLRFELSGASTQNIPIQLYFGPNDYHGLKKYGQGLENHVQLGYGIFAFVKYINRYVVMPVFDFFHNYIGSLGIVILLLTLFIRLIISPLTYSSYLSGAKMKVLRPEIEELKKKYGKDQQAMSMEQMKLFRQAGVNPLGGCIPALLQIPIFFALYSFFNSSLTLRGVGFLWSDDLSSYDTIVNLPFSIPAYGDHVSLFTITATATSFLISFYNTQMTPQQDNPIFKYMIYIFPVILLFIFNSLPSGLTWYYTVSNLVTLLLQLSIQKFIINEKAIHAKIQENKKKPVTKSKWQQRLEQMQQSNQKLQEMRNKSNPKK